MHVVVSGSSGLIGSALCPALVEAGHRPIRLVRRAPGAGADEIQWDPSVGEIDGESLEGTGAVIHLAGAGIGARRWTDSYKRTIETSRVNGTALLASTLAGLATPPRALLSASAVGFYGSRGDDVLTEQSGRGDGFLADLVVDWEAAAQSAIDAGIRTVFLRTGLVLSPEGGALAKQLPLFKLGLGGRFGSGDQYQSWITLSDAVSAMVHLLGTDVSGPVNLTAPDPVTNAEFAATLGQVLGRPTFIPVPAFAPRLLLGREMADALLFDSLRVMPSVLEATGFDFSSPDLETGLRAELGNPRPDA